MKNHAVLKFIAVMLSAFLLMTAVGSGVGIVMLSHYDLYNRTVEQGYEEAAAEVQQDFAQALVFRFASMELGRCSSPLIDDYYGDGPLYHSFRWGRYSYSIRDQEGNVLVGVERELEGARHYEIPVENGRFLCLLSEQILGTPQNQPDVTEPPTQFPGETTEAAAETAVTEAAAEQTQASQETAPEAPAETAAEEAPAEEAAAEEAPAEEAAAEEAAAEEAPAEEAAAEEAPAEEAAAEEAPAEEAAAEEAPAEEAAAVSAVNENSGEEVSAAEGGEEAAPTEAPAEAPTEAPTEPPAEPSVPETQPETAPVSVTDEQGLTTFSPVLRSNGKPYYTKDQFEASFTYEYYDYKPGVMKEATLCFANTSDYTVDLYLARDAMYDYQIWDFLRIIGPWRGELVLVLALSLLLFAALISYLFCAAGKRPGTQEVRAGGLNRLPLDAYALLAAGGVVGCGYLISGGYALFRNTILLQAASAALGAFLGCLLIVGFLFGAAAQIKTPEGFWWRNSLLCRLLTALSRGLLWLLRKFCSQCRKTGPFFKKLGAALHHTISLMPVTWQWVLGTALVMLILCLTIGSRKILLVILGVMVAVAATLYGGYAFGILLDGVKRMRGGDLKSKVDEDLLMGSFKDFAGELNGLADVAGTAAEKHIKSERMKTELITNVSHDIKTPLTSIINYVDLMEKPHSPEEQEVYMEVLSRQSQRLKKLIDDLIEMSKASTGNLQTDITRVNATEAILQALGEFSDKLDRAELTAVFQPGDQEITMMADGRLVWRVLSNLLGNVVKYALPGTRVYVDLTELQEDVLISVKNVSRDALNISGDELMERFVRGDVSRNTEGSGLGLNIAKSLMELQHGQLELLVDGDLFKVTLIFPRN